ncbi:MAG: hypothetical protein ACAI35_17840 [Candidatus Methylacidiphilales bacterium]|nr:hypothetical protein [Candidatus Methylacidiphilales bacterium]
MSRNRLRNSHSLSAIQVAKWVVVMVMLAMLGIGYLMMKTQIAKIAEETRRQDIKLRDLNERNKTMALLLANLKAPHALKKRIEGLRLVNVNELQQVEMRDRVGVADQPQPVASRLARTGAGRRTREPAP